MTLLKEERGMTLCLVSLEMTQFFLETVVISYMEEAVMTRLT